MLPRGKKELEVLVWEALPVQVPLEGRGPSEPLVLGASCIHTLIDVSQESGKRMKEGLGPRRQALRTLNRCQGNLSHFTAENALLTAWPPRKTFRRK